MANKNYWKNSYEYKRILQILDDYWLTEPDEKIVDVKMDFIHKDGKTQHKRMLWRNPNLKSKSTEIAERTSFKLPTLADIEEKSATSNPSKELATILMWLKNALKEKSNAERELVNHGTETMEGSMANSELFKFDLRRREEWKYERFIGRREIEQRISEIDERINDFLENIYGLAEVILIEDEEEY